jgi:hypothetical protein
MEVAMRRWAAPAILVFVLGACSGGGPFTIEWYSVSGCEAVGTVELLPGAQMRTVGEIEYRFSSGGSPTMWCEGLLHRWIGASEFEGYTFDSSEDAPLEFEVTAEGYVYKGGTGTVTTPEGKTITLP